jgi:hypothetical protein
MKKIIHIVRDDKFIDSAINIFSHFSFFNQRYLWPRQHITIQWINQIEKIEIINTEKELVNIINGNADLVILHSLVIEPRYLLDINPEIKLIWISWGYDIYSDKSIFTGRKLLPMDLYKPYTRKYVNRYARKNMISILKCVKYNFFYGRYYFLFAKRVDYIANELFY